MGEIKAHKRCLLVTGTVIPNSNFVTHTNAEARRNEYYEGLIFYSDQFPNEKIYFLENSAYDFAKDTQFQKLFTERQITLMKFPVSDKFEQGKGYQEFEMLDKAVARVSGEFDMFIKITGRYKVRNIKKITTRLGKNLVIDCQKKPLVAQTNVFCCETNLYNKYFAGLYKEVNDSKGVYIEKLVYKKITENNLLGVLSPFIVNPIITGISGSYGGTLTRNAWKMRIRNIERVLMRIIGIKQFLTEY